LVNGNAMGKMRVDALDLAVGAAMLHNQWGNNMPQPLHLIKLSVGTDGVEDLAAWQSSAAAKGPDGLPCHVTRMWPKREAEILNGGSIYWVIKGMLQCRQRILRLDEVTGRDGVRRCSIVLDPELIRTTQAMKKPFQGWRYLPAKDAPPDLPKGRAHEDALPSSLSAALADLGVL
jgi:hypothetical protein